MIEVHLYVPGQVTEIDSTNLEHSVQQFKRAPAQPRRFLIHSSLSRKKPIKKCTALCEGRIISINHLNLSVEGRNILIVKGEESTEKSIEQHPHAPYVSFAGSITRVKNIVASDVSSNACVLFTTCQGNFCLKPALAQHKLGCKRSS